MTGDLLYSETEDALRESVRALLAANCPSDRVASMYDGDESLARDLWGAVSVALELPAIGLPESLGGSGASAREVAVVMEELGRVVAPIPFLTSSVIAQRILGHCGETDLLKSMADGSHVCALAVPFSSFGRTRGESVSVSGGRVTGSVAAVAGAEHADVILVPGLDGADLTLQAVEAAGVHVTRRSSLDMSRPVCDLTFESSPAREIARGQDADDAVSSGLLMGSAMWASEQVGVAEWCLETTVAYVKQRNQFGRPIGSFQAVKHRLARLWISVNSARAAARNAAVLVEPGDVPAKVAVALAQSYCSDVAVLAAEECVQLHGGIGMTWEHPTHLYLKRAKADQLALGTPAHYRARLAALNSL
jgi:alkylation response protein AidB-like acyl-CoA dehydrogenase